MKAPPAGDVRLYMRAIYEQLEGVSKIVDGRDKSKSNV
jgi:hypothetical protein